MHRGLAGLGKGETYRKEKHLDKSLGFTEGNQEDNRKLAEAKTCPVTFTRESCLP